ncbi:DUF6702 family protein [Persicobacter sp. CCB-QB2]|uniref:DUF6702 family protein n=1 Tax=Persicobacter sp. CCB-QB2 TaxID=1561025 RepID=UPI0006A96BF1|nr:DUF6702 family protein [Persicobacter sp. CCB-QB2]
MRKFYIVGVFLLSLVTLSNPVFAHPYHISLLDMKYDVEEKRIEMEGKVFLDDLGDAIFKEQQLQVDWEMGIPEEAVEAYFLEHVKIQWEGDAREIRFVGMEIEDDALWVYCYVEKVKPRGVLEVQNTILFSEFDDQQNLVHFQDEVGLRSERLHSGRKLVAFPLRKV